MNETSKAMKRRWVQNETGNFTWKDIFRGKGIDIGAGDDPLVLKDCTPFDKEDGDANDMRKHFKTDTFDYVHASNVLEHMHDPAAALASWLKITKKGGHVICTVPDFVLYEGLRWPSFFNLDHKSTWSLWLPDSPAPIHCYLPFWLGQFKGTKIRRCQLVDTHYNYKTMARIDQTWMDLGVEAFLEFVLKKNA